MNVEGQRVKEKFEARPTKGVINNRKSKDKSRQHHSKKKGTNNDLQNTTEKTDDRATGTSLKISLPLRISCQKPI